MISNMALSREAIRHAPESNIYPRVSPTKPPSIERSDYTHTKKKRLRRVVLTLLNLFNLFTIQLPT